MSEPKSTASNGIMKRKRFTVPDVIAAKGQRKLVMVTAYDYTNAKLADQAGIELLLVGDSLGMVVQGHETPLPVTLGQMVYHTACVARGAGPALVVADLPFGSYQESPAQAVRSAVRLLRAGAAAVKLEGGARSANTIQALADADVPVMGHIGLTPQSVHKLGGFKVQRNAEQLLADAHAVANSGAFALVVECVPSPLAATITEQLSIPTIGIGAGPACDGQVLVYHDLLGLFDRFRPKFVKAYANLSEATVAALTEFAAEVRAARFPGKANEVE